MENELLENIIEKLKVLSQQALSDDNEALSVDIDTIIASLIVKKAVYEQNSDAA